MRVRHAARSDVGRVREHNEDSWLTDAGLGLALVADGMGGRAAGEVASRMAADAVRAHLEGFRAALDALRGGDPAVRREHVLGHLRAAVEDAARRVFGASLQETERRGMGTTLTVLLTCGAHGLVAHVGDSRAYLVRGGRAVQLTRDHSLIDELVLAGHLTREEAESPDLDRLRCVLARAVGVANEVAVDGLAFDLLPGDRFLLCSDGLSHYVEEDEIAARLGDDIDAAAAGFVDAACERGGHDNVTAVTVACDSDAPEDAARAERFARASDALAALPLFSELAPRHLAHVILAADTFDAAPAEVVLREEQPLPALFVVLEGTVRLTRSGTPETTVGPGGSFGDASLVDRWVTAPTAAAVGPARLVRLTREALIEVARREPEVGTQVVAGFARAAAARLRRPGPKTGPVATAPTDVPAVSPRAPAAPPAPRSGAAQVDPPGAGP